MPGILCSSTCPLQGHSSIVIMLTKFRDSYETLFTSSHKSKKAASWVRLCVAKHNIGDVYFFILSFRELSLKMCSIWCWQEVFILYPGKFVSFRN